MSRHARFHALILAGKDLELLITPGGSSSPAPEPSASPDAEGAPAYGFFESPADSHGEWWWW